MKKLNLSLLGILLIQLVSAQEESIIGETFGKFIPDVSVSGLGTLALWGIGSILFFCVAGVITYFVVQRFKYNKTIVLYRKIGGKPIRALTDKGMFERVGSAGDFWCRLRKTKKILPRPRIEIGKDEYWYYQRKDGEWINFELEDIDETMSKAKIRYDDEDMRLQRLGIQKNLLSRFQKLSFWQKYGGMIMSLIFILVVSVMFIVLFKTMGDSWTQAGQMAEAVRDMANQVQQLSTRIGGGTTPVS